MLNFQELTLSQIPLMKEYFSQCRGRICDQSLGGAVMWRRSFATEFALEDGILFLRSKISPEKSAFTVPFGNLEKGTALLKEHCKATDETLSFCSVSEEDKDRLLSLLPDYSAIPTRDWFDYLYRIEPLATLQGKKLSGQRNHRNFFLKNHPDWAFEEITDDNIQEVFAFYEWYCATVQKDSSYFQDEKKAVLEVFEHRREYGFFGAALRAEGKICAFAFSETIGDTLFVHIEKADRDLRGAYQMIVSKMAEYHLGKGIFYVNREEDVGDPGLRFAKESYHPHQLLAKYIVEKRDSGEDNK